MVIREGGRGGGTTAKKGGDGRWIWKHTQGGGERLAEAEIGGAKPHPATPLGLGTKSQGRDARFAAAARAAATPAKVGQGPSRHEAMQPLLQPQAREVMAVDHPATTTTAVGGAAKAEVRLGLLRHVLLATLFAAAAATTTDAAAADAATASTAYSAGAAAEGDEAEGQAGSEGVCLNQAQEGSAARSRSGTRTSPQGPSPRGSSSLEEARKIIVRTSRSSPWSLPGRRPMTESKNSAISRERKEERRRAVTNAPPDERHEHRCIIF